MEIYHALSACTYSNAVHIFILITASCPANIKHSILQLPRDSSVAVAQIQRLILKEGAPRSVHTESTLGPVAINVVVMVVSDALRSILIIMV